MRKKSAWPHGATLLGAPLRVRLVLSSCPLPLVVFRVHAKAVSSIQCDHTSTVRINLRPTCFGFLPLLFRDLSVLGRAIQALRAQTHVDFVFEVRAHAYRLPHEAFGLAFVERGHDLFAAWENGTVRLLYFVCCW